MAVLLLAGLYNGLVGKRNMVRNAFSTIEVMLKRRHQLIPNLVSAVQGYADHEKYVLQQVVDLRTQAMNANISDAERFQAEQQLSPRVQQLLLVAESYPDLKSSEQFLNLQRNLTDTEEQLAAARRAYNAAVLELNNAVDSIPSNLVANIFGFRRQEFFAADQHERSVVSVNPERKSH